MKSSMGESAYITDVKSLINKIQDDSPAQDSIYEQAAAYFQQQPAIEAQLNELTDDINRLNNALSKIRLRARKASHQKKIEQAELKLKRFTKQQEEARLDRYNRVKQICESILDFTEGDTFEETNRKTAKLLCSIRLICPTEGPLVAHQHAKAKHLYKAVLCLRLLDRMLLDGNINNKYVLDVVARSGLPVTYQSNAKLGLTGFRNALQMPFLFAALLQDVGTLHPDAQNILRGEGGNADPFRVLDQDNRNKLLQISYPSSLRYVTEGIGLGGYVGNSRQERDEFNAVEQQKLQFVQTLLKSWVNPDKGIGNLLKIIQIYTSVILSTKPNFDYKLLPRVFDLLHQKADDGFYNKTTVNSLLTIIGKFPQGYGVAYIPKDSEGRNYDRYEYAIVVGLYPQDERQPLCRMATKQLLFVNHGHFCNISENNNLYFAATRKKLEKIGKERLYEIEQKLSSNFKEKKEQDYIPHCWHPEEFFSNKQHQNLWSTATVVNI